MTSNDTEMIHSVLKFGAGALGFTGAMIVFINSRLQNAKTEEARNNLFANLFMVAEPVLLILGVIFLGLFESKAIGLGVVFLAYCIHCGLFLRGRSAFPKMDILVLAWQSIGMLALCLGVILSEMVTVIGKNAELIGMHIKSTSSNTESIGKIIALIEKMQEAEQDSAGQPATRSHSKSEGGDEAHPESEGRFR